MFRRLLKSSEPQVLIEKLCECFEAIAIDERQSAHLSPEDSPTTSSTTEPLTTESFQASSGREISFFSDQEGLEERLDLSLPDSSSDRYKNVKAKRIQEKENLLASYEVEGKRLSQDELDLVIDVTGGWDSGYDADQLTQWMENPANFWRMPMREDICNPYDVITNCYRVINFGTDKLATHRQRICMEIIELAMTSGSTTTRPSARLFAQHICGQQLGNVDQVVAQIRDFRRKGERLLLLGFGTHFALSTWRYEQLVFENRADPDLAQTRAMWPQGVQRQASKCRCQVCRSTVYQRTATASAKCMDESCRKPGRP